MSQEDLLKGGFLALSAAVKAAVGRVTGLEDKPGWASASTLHRFDPTDGVYNLRGPNTARLRAGIARARGGGAPLQGVVVSDSLMLGTDGVTTSIQGAAPTQIAHALASAAGVELQDTGIRYVAGGVNVPGIGWMMSSGVTLAGVATMFAGSYVEHYDPDAAGDTLDIFWYNYSGFSANFDVQVDGVTVATVVASGAAGTRITTLTGLNYGPHRVRLVAPGNYAFPYGIRLRTANAKAVLHNAAFGGSTAAFSSEPTLSWTPTDASDTTLRRTRFDALAAAGVTDPDLLIICLGANDVFRGVATADIIAAITSIRNIYPNATCVLLGAWGVVGVGATQWAAFRAARYTLSDTLNVPFIDLAHLTGDIGTTTALGLVGSDGNHPTHQLSAHWGRLIGQLLTRLDPERVGVLRRAIASAPGLIPGWHMGLDLDYDTNDPSQAESIMIRVRNAAGVLTKTFWLNESGLPRAWAVRKNEPAEKLHAFSDLSDSPVFEVRGPWNQGAIRRLGINSKGQFLLGPNQVAGNAVITLAAGDAVPEGLPPGTLIVRTS